MTGIDYYSIKQNNRGPKAPVLWPGHPSPPSKPLATSDLLSVSMVLPFQRRHRAGMSCVTF